MKVIWVLENIKKNVNSSDYYINSKLNILLLLCSVHLWRKNHPEDTCVLYADDLTIDTLDKLKVLSFWHTIKPIPNPKKINKEIFWASSKLQVLSSVDEPVIIMDNDTHVYKPIKDKLDLNKVYVCNFEVGKGYYPTAIDPFVQKLSYKPRWQTKSVNVSFLNLPDPEFTREYANMSLQFMEEFTQLKAPNSQYLIFAEQLLLKHLLDKKKIEHKSILSTYWDCKRWEWGEDHSEGIWSIDESEQYFKHYGPLKGYILNDKPKCDYNENIQHLINCLNLRNLDLSIIPNR